MSVQLQQSSRNHMGIHVTRRSRLLLSLRVPYEAPDYQSYALTSPWHTPPKLLKTYVDGSKYPYNYADLFTIIRNPATSATSAGLHGKENNYAKATQGPSQRRGETCLQIWQMSNFDSEFRRSASHSGIYWNASCCKNSLC